MKLAVVMLVWGVALAAVPVWSGEAGVRLLKFAGYEWEVKSAPEFGPGPNAWSESNVRVDEAGCLHLKITQKDGKWSCAEVTMTQRLGFGTYQFQTVGRLDLLDRNVVLGFFNYTTPDVGPDGTNEIDIEMARWGDAAKPVGNFSVAPAVKGPAATHPFEMVLNSADSTHRFTWKPTEILYQSLRGNGDEIASWRFSPAQPAQAIPQHVLPVHINLWLFRGQAPTDGKPVEVVVRSFRFTPL